MDYGLFVEGIYVTKSGGQRHVLIATARTQCTYMSVDSRSLAIKSKITHGPHTVIIDFHFAKYEINSSGHTCMYIYHFHKISRREKDTCFHCLDCFGNTEMNSYRDQDAIYLQKENKTLMRRCDHDTMRQPVDPSAVW
jgi:hypothetical protein